MKARILTAVLLLSVSLGCSESSKRELNPTTAQARFSKDKAEAEAVVERRLQSLKDFNEERRGEDDRLFSSDSIEELMRDRVLPVNSSRKVREQQALVTQPEALGLGQTEGNQKRAEAVLDRAELPEFKYSILHWNVESGGNDPATIAAQLIELGHYDIIGLSEVDDSEPYVDALTQKYPDDFDFIRGNTGINNGRDNDRLLLCVDNTKFLLIEFDDMDKAGDVKFNNGRHRAPLYVRLKDRINGQELIVIQNHFAEGDADFRAQQAAGLREWARTKSTPMICIGDFNFDYDFHTEKGNSGFDAFLKDGIWKWIKPVEMIDTNWSDDGKGGDRYPDSMLDFSFVAGAAKDWKAECRVIVRDGDFPDDDKTSDHRPVELILKN